MINLKHENLNRYNRSFEVFKNMRGTSMYYEESKKNVMAMLRQLGCPTFFFTLSCADMRWSENFAAILNEKGYEINYERTSKDEDGYMKTDIQARKPGQTWKPIK